MAQIPYLYVAELGGYELDSKRNRKTPRMPNPAVPFSYLSYSLEQETPVLPIFVTSPGADESSRKTYSDVFTDDELIALLRAILLGENPNDIHDLLRRKVFSLVIKLAALSRHGRTLTSQQWENAYASLHKGQLLVDFLVHNAPLSWSKTAYIAALTSTAKALMKLTSSFAIGLTSTELPMCIVDRNNRPEIENPDGGIWRRIREIPFDQVVPEQKQDRKLKQKLCEPEHMSAVLNWLVEGCLAWQEKGLDMPEEVRNAIEEYQQEMDHVREFLEDCTDTTEGSWENVNTFKEAYISWCLRNRANLLAGRLLIKVCEAKGSNSAAMICVGAGRGVNSVLIISLV